MADGPAAQRPARANLRDNPVETLASQALSVLAATARNGAGHVDTRLSDALRSAVLSADPAGK